MTISTIPIIKFNRYERRNPNKNLSLFTLFYFFGLPKNFNNSFIKQIQLKMSKLSRCQTLSTLHFLFSLNLLLSYILNLNFISPASFLQENINVSYFKELEISFLIGQTFLPPNINKKMTLLVEFIRERRSEHVADPQTCHVASTISS